MRQFSTTDPRVTQIGPQTWVDSVQNTRWVFEPRAGQIQVFDLRTHGTDPVNEEPFDDLDAAITEYLGASGAPDGQPHG